MNHTVDLRHDKETYRALAELDRLASRAAAECGLDARLIELVKIRVSQLNGCAFCLRMHTRDALQLGESADRLAVLSAWWESQYFTSQERAALNLAEQITLQAVGAPTRTVDSAVLHETQAAAIGWVTIVINSWNRVAVVSGYPVAPEKPA